MHCYCILRLQHNAASKIDLKPTEDTCSKKYCFYRRYLVLMLQWKVKRVKIVNEFLFYKVPIRLLGYLQSLKLISVIWPGHNWHILFIITCILILISCHYDYKHKCGISHNNTKIRSSLNRSLNILNNFWLFTSRNCGKLFSFLLFFIH